MTRPPAAPAVPFRRAPTFVHAMMWIVPAALVLGADELSWRVGMVAALLVGAWWQAGFRRDLADRLTPMAGCVVVAVLVVLALPIGEPDDQGRMWSVLVALVAALVMTEQVLRLRDDRRRRASGHRTVAREGVGPGS